MCIALYFVLLNAHTDQNSVELYPRRAVAPAPGAQDDACASVCSVSQWQMYSRRSTPDGHGSGAHESSGERETGVKDAGMEANKRVQLPREPRTSVDRTGKERHMWTLKQIVLVYLLLILPNWRN